MDELVILEGRHHEQGKVHAACDIACKNRVSNMPAPYRQALTFTLFDVAPDTANIFKFDSKTTLSSQQSFPRHAKVMVDMVDVAVNMLGPDLSDLDEGLIAMGRRHINYGVNPKDLPAMGTALIFALQKVLGDAMTSKVQHAWTIIFSYMISKMSLGLEEAFRDMEMLQ